MLLKNTESAGLNNLCLYKVVPQMGSPQIDWHIYRFTPLYYTKYFYLHELNQYMTVNNMSRQPDEYIESMFFLKLFVVSLDIISFGLWSFESYFIFFEDGIF